MKHSNTSGESGEQPAELKRAVGTWGSFCMGYADVGADVYIALGLVALYASSAAPLALALAAITYVATGLCYAELATEYPVAGGAQLFAQKALGKTHGFVAGWGLMLDYTIDMALFSLASIGYLGTLVKILQGNSFLLSAPYFGIASVILILTLVALNIVGIRYSSKLNEILVAVDLISLVVIVVFGLPVLLSGGASEWASRVTSLGLEPTWGNFAYATSLAVVSYVGIESISQAAEETKNPRRVIPKATKAAILSVVVITLTMSLYSVILVDPSTLAKESQAPMVILVSRLPLIAPAMIIWISLVGFTTCYISTNTGVIGVSRVSYSMGRLHLFPSFFARIHPRFRTPYVAIGLYGLIAMLLILTNTFLPGIDLLSLIASLYNFGALVAYMYVNLSLIILRIKVPTRRAWKMPGNIAVNYKGTKYDIPIIPIIGFISCLVVWLIVVGTHELGRILGSIWFGIGLVMYYTYNRKKGANNG